MVDNAVCPACGHGKASWFGTCGDYTLYRCKVCALIFVAPMPSADVLCTYYESSKDVVAYEDDETTPRVQAMVREACALLGDVRGKALDIGCGDGEFLAFARDAGFDVLGIEGDGARVARCREQGLAVCQGFFPEVDVGDDKFSLVWVSHVLEHVPDPRAFMRAVTRVLVPGGVVCVRLPNAASPAFRVCGVHHNTVIPPEHLTWWTPGALCGCMESVGLEVLQCTTWGGRQQFKDMLAYFLKGKFLRPASGGVGPSVVYQAREKHPVLAAGYAVVDGVGVVLAPVFERMGGSEIVGIFSAS